MDILFDTANLDDIKRLTPIYPVTGVTTNPTILKAEGRVISTRTSAGSARSSAPTAPCMSRFSRRTPVA